MMDDIDRQIITLYSRNPRISQEEIAKILGKSQPSITARIRKLRDKGGLEMQVGINPAKLGLNLSKVEVTTTNKNEILRMFRGCPYYLNSYSVSGRHNLCLLFISENISTMESIVNGHLRPSKHVKDVEFNIIINTDKPLVLPLELTPTRNDAPPCGILLNCRDCDSFKDTKCNGCPVTGQYNGWLF